MTARPANKYHLKDLHNEIDLFDRKIAHCSAYEIFETAQQRAEALRKLETKRDALVKVADQLVAQGVEYDAKDLPRSYKNQQPVQRV